MESIDIFILGPRRSAVVFKNGAPDIMEPITKPVPTIQPETRPDENDPFNVPAPKINPTPKGFF